MKLKSHSPRMRRAAAYLMSVLALALLTAICLAMANSAVLEHRKSLNQRDSMNAGYAAESGLAYLSQQIEQLTVAGANTEQVLASLASGLDGQIDTVAVSTTSSYLTVPSISIGGGQSFSASVRTVDSDTLALTVTGLYSDASRSLQIEYDIGFSSRMFDYGPISEGPLSLSGQGSLYSADTSSDESMAYADACSLYMGGTALTVSGQNSICHGDMYTPASGSSATDIHKKAVIGATSGGGDYVQAEHIHTGISPFKLATPNPSIFDSYITTYCTPLPSTAKGDYVNVIIPKNTNPTFSSKTTLKGLIYIEAPNNVSFSGKVDIQGVIVTEDATDETDPCTLTFSGQSSLSNVATLDSSEDPSFDELKDLASGLTILAPGFDVDCSGQFDDYGGTLVAENFSWKGQSNALIKGSIISYNTLTFSGQGNLTFDRSSQDTSPDYFTYPVEMILDMGSYTELP